MSRHDEQAWVWAVGGRYGYWAVDKYIAGDTSHGTYGDSLTFRTKKDATAVANALNAAFAAGKRYARQQDGTACPDCEGRAYSSCVACGGTGRASETV